MASASMKWARLLNNHKDIPQIFQKSLSQILDETNTLPSIIYAPQDMWRKRNINDKLLFIYKNLVYSLESVENSILIACHPFENIIRIEHGKILLYSWIRIVSVIDNNIVSSIIEYNTVVESFFKEIMKTIRDSIINTRIKTISSDNRNSFYSTEDLTCRLQNYTDNCLLPSQKVISAVFQPAIFENSWFITKNLLMPNQLAILTDEEFIIYKEEYENADISKFGGVWTYIPLNQIRDLERIPDTSSNLIQLCIRLNGSQKVILLYPLKRGDDVSKLISYINAQRRK
ncbi:MAG: hypothetical protein K0R93_2361 [Anaerosolibacter sp.]|jgi:hypothetical protein|uniref:hypothetical protein n=1 Tax=Anaerosolibacter sp. TaxID=1872527 RepID=UPI0026320AE1|nr:hypothetical protein [Anaerosolibacter sp.]MDF2547463.1 hypothetical protein [Anaerosolibacter sp.]